MLPKELARQGLQYFRLDQRRVRGRARRLGDLQRPPQELNSRAGVFLLGHESAELEQTRRDDLEGSLPTLCGLFRA